MATPVPDEQTVARRLSKRQAAVQAIKRSPEYARLQELRMVGASEGNADEDLRPHGTPDPTDLTVSKRKWEAQVQHWRRKLKELLCIGSG